ncbi:MAG: HTH domain-containing protein [Patescibacteria group bacterium]|nr:HTH domain-containing protein [Patescibacteria group bacterium]
MKTDTAKKIVEYISENKQATAKELVDYLEISRQAVFKHLSQLSANNQIYKTGKPPKVFYFVQKKVEAIDDVAEIDSVAKKIIEENYLIITSIGARKNGLEGFIFWCQKTNQPIQKTAKEYVKTLKKYNAFKKAGFINGMAKMKSVFPQVYLDNLFYIDFYSIERFGKTKLGQMLLYAKQSQNKALTKELILDIKPRVRQLIKKYKIDGVGFIPPTVKRETQFIKEMEKGLGLEARKISITKIKTEIAVPQKTLSKLPDRIENAQKTIIVGEKKKYKNILLIDDAVGSGATLNETAAQIRAKGICHGKIVGLAITGSFKGFDVISEV